MHHNELMHHIERLHRHAEEHRKTDGYDFGQRLIKGYRLFSTDTPWWAMKAAMRVKNKLGIIYDILLDTRYTENQLYELSVGLINETDISIFSDFRLSSYHMWELRDACEYGLINRSNAESFNDPHITVNELEARIRQHKLDIISGKSLFDNRRKDLDHDNEERLTRYRDGDYSTTILFKVRRMEDLETREHQLAYDSGFHEAINEYHLEQMSLIHNAVRRGYDVSKISDPRMDVDEMQELL